MIADSSMLEVARAYLKRGFSIIPLYRGTKKPAGDDLPIELDQNGNPVIDGDTGKPKHTWKPYQRRYATEEELQNWFGNGKARDIGIVTGQLSGISVVDLDNEGATKYAEAHNFPRGPLVKTGKDKAYHLYCLFKAGTSNFQKRDDLPGIDLRSEGGYVVAPPSMHPSGRQYAWVTGRGLYDVPFPELPDVILAKFKSDKASLKDLYQGTEQGRRNDSLARLVGSWVNDGLSLEECVDVAGTWNSRNSPPMPLTELERTVKSIFEKHQREKNKGAEEGSKKTEEKNMRPTHIGKLLNKPDEKTEWLAEGLLIRGGFSGIGAKPKVGKSTLARNLALAVARGSDFLGMKTTKGPVIYYSLEEKESEVVRHFRAMGVTETDDIHIYSGAASPDAIFQVQEAVKDIKPILIVIDPLFRLVRIKDQNAYAESVNKLDPLLRIARDYNVHVMFLHHNTKTERDGVDAFLGSIGISASVDTILVMKRYEGYRTIHTVQRYGEDLDETVLAFDRLTGLYDIGKTKKEEDIASLEEHIVAFLKPQAAPLTEDVIMDKVEGRLQLKRQSLRQLVEMKRIIREGKGQRGDPYKYSCSLVPTISREQGNENPQNGTKPNNDALYSRSDTFPKPDHPREQESDWGNLKEITL